MIGRTVSHYKILDKLGAGGMGEVYVAEDTRLGRKVALKILSAKMAADPEWLERFEREAKAVAALNHPNIVTIYSVEKEEGIYLFTMELVEGETLGNMIPSAGLALPRIFDLAIPLAEALSAAHARGITHRDLKPSNIMVSEEGRVKILDFGLAKLRGEAAASEASELETRPVTGEGRILGTVPYMSPEQVQGKPADHRTDIFSLGIILYEMATGRRPFQGDTPAELVSAILRDTPPLAVDRRDDLPRHLGRIIRLCLEKDPARRFQSAMDVRNELEDLRREIESDELLSGSVSVVRKRRAKGRPWVLPAGVAVVVLAAAIGYWQLRGERDILEPVGEARPVREEGLSERKMIVVLPFGNLGSAEDEYFAAGITEEITSRLGVVSGLGVISRTSAYQYDRTGKTVKQIGQDLGVDYVLEGTVRWDRRPREESRVRVTPQLIRVSDDTHLWSAGYDRVIEDIFAVQSDIAEQVFHQLDVTLLEPQRGAIEAEPTENVDAYHAYLRALDYVERRGEEDIRLAVRLLERAVELDPGYAIAHASLSKAQLALFFFGYDRTEDRLALSKDAVDRALAIEPDLPDVHEALGYYYYWGHLDYDRALREFRIAASGRPNDADLLENVAYIRRRQGRFEEAIDNLEMAWKLNPHSGALAAELGNTYWWVRRFADADRYFDRVISLAPDLVGGYLRKAWICFGWEGDAEKARRILASAPRGDNPSSIWTRFWFELWSGEPQAALDLLRATPLGVIVIQGHVAPKSLLAGRAYHLIGRPDEARASDDSARVVLEKAARERPEDARIRSALGLAYAGLGRKEEAIREGRLAVDLYPVSRDAVLGPTRVTDLATIYAMVGEHDAAIDQIEYLLSIPSLMSVPYLRMAPAWDPLREHPRFQKLLEGKL